MIAAKVAYKPDSVFRFVGGCMAIYLAAMLP